MTFDIVFKTLSSPIVATIGRAGIMEYRKIDHIITDAIKNMRALSYNRADLRRF